MAGWLTTGSALSLLALIVSLLVIGSNTKAQRQANRIKEQENALKYIYDRRTKLRMKLVWLTRFVHNDIAWSQLQIDEDNHPYKLSEFQWGFVPKCSGDKFCYTILNELYWLHNEMQVLFPSTANKYHEYCDKLRDAYAAHVDPQKLASEEVEKIA